MTKTLALQATAAVLSVFMTVGTFACVTSIAKHEVVQANAVATAKAAQLPHLAAQTVVIVGHRIAKA